MRATGINHVSISATDLEASTRFYEAVFGYAHDDMNTGEHGIYHMIKSSDGRARGGVMRLPDANAPSLWTPYVRVEDVDDIAARVAPLGGKLLVPPTDIPDVGRIAILVDPLGAALGFIKPAVKA